MALSRGAAPARREQASLYSSLLLFVLGFLTAAFLALLAAPAIWRRAVTLTRHRIEASVPLTMNEIRADKDRLRAEHAVTVRQLEMALDQAREKAAMQAIAVGRNIEEFRRRDEEKAELERQIAELDQLSAGRQATIEARDEAVARLEARIVDLERALEERIGELDRMIALFEEATLTATNRQVDLVARESEVDRLAKENAALRAERRDLEHSLNATLAEARGDREALKVERRRSVDTEKRLDRTIAALSDREEKLERREKELARLRESMRGGGDLVAERSERLRLEAEIADLSARLQEGGVAETAQPVAARLEERLRMLTRENRMLRAELAGAARLVRGDGERSDEEVLREAIGEIAAEVVSLTMSLEGEDSPLARIVAEGAESDSAGQGRAGPSIAERVRALRKAAAE